MRSPTIESLERRTLLSTATLVKDLNLVSKSSNPSAVTSFNGSNYFLAARGGNSGAELYQTDGTAEGTNLVKVLNPSSNSQDVGDMQIAVVGGSMYFAIPDGSIPGSTPSFLWKSDGTAAGTVVVPGEQRTTHRALIEFDDQLYFYSDGTNEPAGKRHLRRTDGTTTTQVGVFDLGTSSVNNTLTAMNGWLYFVGDDGTHGYELCRTDGTTTENVTDVNPSTASAAITYTAVFNNRLYFSAFNPTFGREVWSTDGTSAGTSLLMDIKPGAGGMQTSLRSLGGSLCITAEDATHGGEPWISDGTEAGTHLIMDVRPGTAWSNVGFFAELGTRIFFRGDDPLGFGTYASDGTEATTVRLGDAWGSEGIVLDGMLHLWRGGTSTKGFWKTDGSLANTTRLFTGGAEGGANMRWIDGKILFAGYDLTSGAELFVSDLTLAGTGMVKELSTQTDTSDPTGISVGGTMFFQATHGPGGRKALYKSDGTAAGTVLLVENDAVLVSDFAKFVNVGGTIYFSGRKVDGNHYNQLWKSDGTVAGTVKVTTQEFSTLENFFAVDGKLVFAGAEPTAGHELWISDGTAAGTHILVDLNPGPGFSAKGPYQQVGNTLFFTLRNADSTTNHSLWKTDGTAAGTVLVKQMNMLSAANQAPNKFESAAIGGKLIFFTEMYDGTTLERALWTSDGTSDGTVRVKVITSEGGITYNDKYYFCGNASDGAGGELWVTDGTLSGTVRLTDINPGPADTIPLDQVVAGTRIVFSMLTSTGGTIGYYDTDDGSSGMLYPAQTAGMPSAMTLPVSTGELGYFTANIGSGGNNRFLWQTDGTAAGTIKVPGHTFAMPSTYGFGATAANESLFFRGNDGLTGNELWIVPSGSAPRSPGTLSGLRRGATPNVVDLQWSRDTDMNGYRLQRSTSASFATIDFTINLLAERGTYTDLNASTNTSYYYRLFAYNHDGVSAPRVTTVAAVIAAPAQPHLDSDTGTNASDNITKDNTPTFSGTATAGTNVQIYADGLLVGGGPIIAGSWQATASTLSDGPHTITAVAVDGQNQTSTASAALGISIDTVAPTFSPSTPPSFAISPSHRLTVTLTENLAGILLPASLQLSNLTSGGTVAPSDIELSTAGNAATFDFSGVPGGRLSDGYWNASLAVTDVAGNAFAGPAFAFIYAGSSPTNSFFVRRSGTAGTDVEIFNDGAPSARRQPPYITAAYATLSQLVIEGTIAHQDVTIEMANGSPLPLSGFGFSFVGMTGSDDLTIRGAASTSLAGDLGATTPGIDVHVNDGAGVSLTGARLHLGSLTIDGGSVEANASQPVVVTSNLSIANGGKLDLRDGDLMVDYSGTSVLLTVQALINAARAGGTWTGSGLTSSLAKFATPKNKTLGALEAGDFKGIYGAGAQFSGEDVDTTAVLVKFTYYGDVDFNGIVDFDDYSRIDAGFNNNRTGWLNGDVDGNGIVDFDDYSLIDQAFNTQDSPLRPVQRAVRDSHGEHGSNKPS